VKRVKEKREVRMLRQNSGRQALSMLLAGAMIMTSVGIVPKVAEAADPENTTTGTTALTNGAITADITTDFQVKIGSDMYDLNLYGNGLFETKAILDAGSYSAELYKDGTDTGIADTFTVEDEKQGPEDKPVYLRVDGGTAADFKGTFEDSINGGFIHSENLPGNFGDSRSAFLLQMEQKLLILITGILPVQTQSLLMLAVICIREHTASRT
jgi:hypothetical protein